jgi:hypothetical protein
MGSQINHDINYGFHYIFLLKIMCERRQDFLSLLYLF